MENTSLRAIAGRILMNLMQWNSHKIIRFFCRSLIGVIIDLFVFQIAILVGISPLCANLISSSIAITATYFLISQYVFEKNFSVKHFLLFFLYYSFSIFAFSLGIHAGVQATGWPPLACKIISLPISFAVNFAFSKLLFGKK